MFSRPNSKTKISRLGRQLAGFYFPSQEKLPPVTKYLFGKSDLVIVYLFYS